MEGRAEFLNKLSGLVDLAKEKGYQITIEEVKNYFNGMNLTEEQLELVFDYLLAQKVVVKGYIKMQEEKEEISYTEEEEEYLREYLADLKAFKKPGKGEKEALILQILQGDMKAKTRLTEIYLPEVVEIAKEFYHSEIFLGDLIQEGNVGLILGLDMLTDAESAQEIIVAQIRQSIHMLTEEQDELNTRDKKMVEKVSALDEAIKTLTEELGRKVSLEELAVYMGLTEEEIEDILRLTGEEAEEDTEE